MCGLLGFIGESSNKELSQKITTALFAKTESRGTDASGFYCLGQFNSNEIYYYKKPIKSSLFVKQDEYKSIWDYNLNLGIFHCRAASAGVGVPIVNENNHPFVSSDFKKAVMHNGLIEKSDYDLLKTYYEVETSCDSEIILRILEQNDLIYDKLSLFYENTNNSAYAVAYSQNDNETRELYLFRNELRPLYVVDFSKQLNQIFFFSTIDILLSSMAEANFIVENLRIHEIQPYNLLCIKYDKANDLSLEQFFVQQNDTSPKTDMNYNRLKKNKTDWKNKIITKDLFSFDVVNGMCNKFNDNLEKLKLYLQNANQENTDQEKINLIFQYLKDSNKKIENVNKIISSYDLHK